VEIAGATGAAFTASVAALLVAVPAVLVTTAAKVRSAVRSHRCGARNSLKSAPAMFTAFFCHSVVSGRFRCRYREARRLSGRHGLVRRLCEIAGATGAAFTVSVAALWSPYPRC